METRREISAIRQENERQLCNHALTGRAPQTKMCAHNYECGSCPYDQMLEDVAHLPQYQPEAPRDIVKAA
jgi:hypothetical protein